MAPRLTLLGLSPMSRIRQDEDTSTDKEDSNVRETAPFDAETHLSYFKNMFPFYELDFEKWCLCLVADNTITNIRISRISRKPHVGCASHKLHLEVNRMTAQHADMNNTIDSVYTTTTAAKQFRSCALLRNLTDYKPIVRNQTRWSGKRTMLHRFLQIQKELIEVHASSESNNTVDGSLRFFAKVKRYGKMIAQIEVISKAVQTKGYLLSQYRDALDVLIESVQAEHNNADSPLHRCKLGKFYIASDANIVADPSFESAVVKFQKGMSNLLSSEETTAATRLQLEQTDPCVQSTTASRFSITEQLEKKQRTGPSEGAYMNCDFIVGSVAELERLFSTCSYVLTKNRCSMTPQLFEEIMFLKTMSVFGMLAQ